MIYKLLLPALFFIINLNACAQKSEENSSDKKPAEKVAEKNSSAVKKEYSITATPTKWRGPNADGIYPESNLLDEWPEAGPEELWVNESVGVGHSSPAIANGKIYVTGMEGENTGTLFVLSQDGKLLKKKAYGTDWTDSYPGSRSTPTVVGDLVYVYSSQGELVCLDEETLDVVWKKNVFEDFDGKNIKWGVTETPVVEGEKIYISPGGEKDNVVALNRFTGEKIWSSPGKGEISAYCTPLLVDLPKRKLLVTMMESHIIGIDRETGEFLWAHHQPNRYSVHANTPLYHDGHIFYSSGYRKGSGMLELNEDGSSVTEKWYTEELDNRMGGMVLIDGYIYSSGQSKRGWQALDWETGEQKFYETGEIFKGVVIAADNKLYCYSQRGELALAKPNPEKFEVISQTKVTHGSAQHWSHPVIKDGVLYQRHGEALVAYKIK